MNIKNVAATDQQEKITEGSEGKGGSLNKKEMEKTE